MATLESLKKCPICGKMFVPTFYWCYKIHKNNRMNYYCRYNCYRNAGGGKGKFVNIIKR